MYSDFSRHHIDDPGQIPFDAAAYSKFKFGDGDIARAFGQELGRHFVELHGDALLAEENIVFVPSPYHAIPTASNALSLFFRDEVNRFLFRHQRKSLLQSKIHRYKTYTVDYGNLDFEERMRLISSDTYHLDKHFLEGRMVLFIDDIKITGSHEQIIRQQLEREEIKGRFVFVYYAQLMNKAIPPNFENYLNYFAVKDRSDLVTIINEDNFIMNTRIIKYILKSDPVDLMAFIHALREERLPEMVNYAIGNNYHLMEDYQHNLMLITNHINYGN
ncbi:phosphoribosyltransferase family protein [Taibaiella koreensis]|uniref:phosphoribosyltransferase family protein n=1 Tax=Taibaiella koreensis TaxID=1268548 RepID=UPI000E599C1D|nr:phosphoribosyltransferase family protein [Taibaiella koreensis]